MKNLFVFIICILLFSCNEKFNPNEFNGTWISLDSDESYNEILPTFTFQNDSVYIETLHTYGLNGNYMQKNNKIIIYLEKDSLVHSFHYDSKDSSIYIKGNKYFNYSGFFKRNHFLNYELLNLNIERDITSDSLSKYDNGFHLFKDSKDSLKLKLNDKITSDFELIPNFLIGHNRYESFGSAIYVDKKIIVKELIKPYVKLWQVNQKNNLIITGYDIKTNSYSGFKDRIEFWSEQIDLYSKEKYEPIKPKILLRKQYLKKYYPVLILINSSADFYKLKDIIKDNNYLIQINTNMNFKTYIDLKVKISEIKKKKKIRIRTEFNLFLKD